MTLPLSLCVIVSDIGEWLVGGVSVTVGVDEGGGSSGVGEVSEDIPTSRRAPCAASS